MERVLVCGGRDFGCATLPPWEISEQEASVAIKKGKSERELAFRVLDRASQKFGIECIIQGGAKGADRLGREWALDRGFQYEEYPADWKRLGKKAGIVRNQTMIDEAKPDLVIAFPGGTGTRDMVSRAKKAGIRVIEVNL